MLLSQDRMVKVKGTEQFTEKKKLEHKENKSASGRLWQNSESGK